MGELDKPTAIIMARVYADVNEHMPRSYWDYDSVNISWGVLENYEIVRKIGKENLIGAIPLGEWWSHLRPCLDCGDIA